jgi:hypothetical protein
MNGKVRQFNATSLLGPGPVRTWLASAALYYPIFWVACSALSAGSQLARSAVDGRWPERLMVRHEGIVVPHLPSSGILFVSVLVLAVLVEISVGQKSAALGGLTVAILGHVALFAPLGRMAMRSRITVPSLLATAACFAVLCFGLRRLSAAWLPEEGGGWAGYLKRVGKLASVFVVMPLALGAGLEPLAFRFWLVPVLLAAPSFAGVLVAGWRSGRVSGSPSPPSWKPVWIGALLTATLVAGVPVLGRAVDDAFERARVTGAQKVLASLPSVPSGLPYPRLFFQKGVNFTAEFPARYDSDEARGMLHKLPAYGINAIALVPYGGSSNRPPTVRRYGSGSWENDEGIEELSRVAHASGMRVFLRPAIWDSMSVDLQSRADREEWFAQYADFLDHYAELGRRVHADLFGVGGELIHLSAYDAEWRRLIAQIRRRYAGPLVYGANFGDEFESVTFWDDLDYIGLQEYYALPDDLSTRALVSKVEAVQRRYGKPVLFTEAGFPSREAPNREPWDDQSAGQLSLTSQARCYEAVFRAFYAQRWFAGVYWWKVGTNGFGGPDDGSHTPWNKPAMEVIRQWYTQGGR